jgi:protein-tyrosine phosphatase
MLKAFDYIVTGGKHIYSTGRVAFDKLQYLLSIDNMTPEEEDAMMASTEEEIEHYQNVLKIDTYNTEKDNARILPHVSYYDQCCVFFSQPTHIVDNIYLGSAFNAASYNTLKDNNISVIFNITKEISNYFPKDFTYYKCNIYDNNKHSISSYLEKIYQEIRYHQQKTEGNILIHCYMGASRSASVVLYYVMKTCKNNSGEYLSFDEALNFIKSKRQVVNPTFRFTKDLAKSILDA